eukprot:m.417232 g.417232  ORF g.417232 m.417232 type:complete len:1364 (-) comp16833_c0_seq5:141-4232(-)
MESKRTDADDVQKQKKRTLSHLQSCRSGPERCPALIKMAEVMSNEQVLDLTFGHFLHLAVRVFAEIVPQLRSACLIMKTGELSVKADLKQTSLREDKSNEDSEDLYSVMSQAITKIDLCASDLQQFSKETIINIMTTLTIRSLPNHKELIDANVIIETLESMINVSTVCEQPEHRSMASVTERVEAILRNIHKVKGGNREEYCRVIDAMCDDDKFALDVYATTSSCCDHVQSVVGQPLIFAGDTISLNADADPWWVTKFETLSDKLKVVAAARNWFYFGTGQSPELDFLHSAMRDVLMTLDQDKTRGWIKMSPRPSYQLTTPRHTVVGLDNFVDRVSRAVISAEHDLVNVFGQPGVGKTEALQAIETHHQIQAFEGLRLRMSASTNAQFECSVVESVAQVRPNVVASLMRTPALAAQAAVEWLSTTNEPWLLLVDDAHWTTTRLWKILESTRTGRAVIVSELPLWERLDVFQEDMAFELKPRDQQQSLAILRSVRVFAPHPESTYDESDSRHRELPSQALDTAMAHQEAELNQPEFLAFLEKDLNFNPRSILVCGYASLIDPSITNAKDLMQWYNSSKSQIDDDSVGRNKYQDRRFIATAQAILGKLEALRRNGTAVVQKQALTVLATISLLDRSQTPRHLLSGHNIDELIANLDICRSDQCFHGLCEDPACSRARDMLNVFCDDGCMDMALALCDGCGFIQATPESYIIGKMDYYEQRMLQRILVTARPPEGVIIVNALRNMLVQRFSRDKDSDYLQQLLPCVRSWCTVTLGDFGDTPSKPSVVAGTAADAELLNVCAGVTLATGNIVATETILRRVLSAKRRLLGHKHLDIATVATDLGQVYSKMGRHQDALNLHQEALRFRLAHLDADHPLVQESQALTEASRQAVESKQPGSEPDQPEPARAADVPQSSPQNDSSHSKNEAAAAADVSALSPSMSQDQKLSKKNVAGGDTCAMCKKEAPLRTMGRCSRCRAVCYCSEECHRKHWKQGGHKRVCSASATIIKLADPVSAEPPLFHRCPCCLTNEDDSGQAGMCPACGTLFCGECNTVEKIGRIPCPTCQHPLQTLEDEDRVELLKRLVDPACREPGRHVGPAYHLLGNHYANGDGVVQDHAIAARYFRLAAEHGSEEAHLTLGVYYEKGLGVVCSHSEAIRIYRQIAMTTNNPKAMFNLGNAYYVGKGVAVNHITCARWMKRSAELGYAEAQMFLGSLYERGYGIVQSNKEAFTCFKLASEQGLVAALNSVGNSLLHGLGTAQNVAESAVYFERAAAKGHAHAMVSLGALYQKGRNGIEKDEAKAAQLFQSAAGQGNVGGLFHLGACYVMGRGVPRDWKMAEELLKKAAHKGHAHAQHYLAIIQHTTPVA